MDDNNRTVRHPFLAALKMFEVAARSAFDTAAAFWRPWSRSCRHATGTADREQAEAVFAEWLQLRRKSTGPSDPDKILVAEVLNDYAIERGPKVAGKETLANAITNLAKLWDGKTVAEIPFFVDSYVKKRDRAAGTVRRELGVLQ